MSAAGNEEVLADWERLLAAERHLQALLPGTVRVGGTAAALHAQHRISLDGDHVLSDLQDRFDEVLAWARGSLSMRPRSTSRAIAASHRPGTTGTS